MSITIIHPRHYINVVSYVRQFSWRDTPSAGFSFECSEDGEVKTPEHEAGRENLKKCLDGTYDVIDNGVQSWPHSYVEPAVGRCVCGAEVVLEGFTNTCDKCERDYNSSGQELAPRGQWGEETGETAADILRGDFYGEEY